MAEFLILATPRLTVRPFVEADLTSRYVGWLNDPNVVRYSEQRHRRHDLEECRHYWRAFAGTPHYFCAIEAREPELGHIGNITVTVDTPNLVADMAILIGESRVRGLGTGLEAWRMVLAELLQRRGLRKVTAGCMALNRSMLTVMERSGMTFECRRKGQFLVDGEPVDCVHYASLVGPP